MDLQWYQRTLLVKAIDVYIGVLKRSERSDREIPKVEVVTGSDERAEFFSVGVPGRQSEQRLATGVVTVVSAKHRPVEVKAPIEVGSVETASPSVDVNAPWLKISPSMGVTAKEANGQVIGEPVIDAQRHSSRGQVVTFSEVAVADADEITPAGHPDAPPVLRGGLQHRLFLDHGFPRLFFDHAILPALRRWRFVDVEARAQTRRAPAN